MQQNCIFFGVSVVVRVVRQTTGDGNSFRPHKTALDSQMLLKKTIFVSGRAF